MSEEKEEEGASAAPSYAFDEDFQTKIAALVIRDSDFARKTEGLIKPEYFINEAQAALVRIAIEYLSKYRKAPDRATFVQLMKDAVAKKTIRSDLKGSVKEEFLDLIQADASDREFIIEKVAEFARHQATERAILQSVEALGKGDFAKIEKLVRSAMDVGVSEDAGEYNFFEKIKDRTERRKELASGTATFDGITTGYPDLDKHLYHRGWGRKELAIMMAPAKGGKSMALADFAKNAALVGKNVLICTLEVSADIYASRMDASLSDVMMRELIARPEDVEKKIEALESKSGKLIIREYATGTMKPSMLRRTLDRYRDKGTFFDMVVVDYGDIMAPEHRVDSVQENSRTIYVDLRAIAQDYDVAMLTATQTNRDGAKATVSTAIHVAEDFNKIRIADIVISINAAEDEKSRGEARLFFAAHRNGRDSFTLRIKQDRSRMKFLVKILAEE